MGVAEHDDVADAEHLHREFERREHAMADPVRRERRHQIGDVAHDEQLARMSIEDHLRRDPGIAAADDHDVRRLAAPRELTIAVALGRHPPDEEIAIALDEAKRESRHVRHERSSDRCVSALATRRPDLQRADQPSHSAGTLPASAHHAGQDDAGLTAPPPSRAEAPGPRCYEWKPASPPTETCVGETIAPAPYDRRDHTEAPAPPARAVRSEVFIAFLRLGAHLVRRPDRPSRLLPAGVRRPPPLARRGGLCRPRGAVPIPAGAGEQRGRHRHRPDRAGLAGALAAWTGFTLPSAIALVLFALGVERFGSLDAAWLHGLKIAAVAVVAQAVWGMARHHGDRQDAGDARRRGGRDRARCADHRGPIGAIALGALAGIVLLRNGRTASPRRRGRRHPPWLCDRSASRVFFALLVGLPLLAAAFPTRRSRCSTPSIARARWCSAAATWCCRCCRPPWCRRAGSANDAFLAGYGAAQAVPGPLFTFAAYLGAVMGPAAERLDRRRDRLVAIFLPSFLLVIGVLPFWQAAARQAVRAIGARPASTPRWSGLLLAALYDPVWTQRHHGAARFRGGARRVPPARSLEDAAMAGRRALCRAGGALRYRYNHSRA